VSFVQARYRLSGKLGLVTFLWEERGGGLRPNIDQTP
jgi:hypothetical protein